MPFKLPKLPYPTDALEPIMSKDTLEFHYGKHHAHYVKTLNELTEGTRFAKLSLEEVIQETAMKDDAIFHNAAQTWNHTFFWNCLSPQKTKPSVGVRELIENQFTSLDDFKQDFTKAATGLFGSGWVWLVKNSDESLSIEPMANAGTPIADGKIPLFALDVWEHAYYLDYQNERPKFVMKFWSALNWDFVDQNLESETQPGLRLGMERNGRAAPEAKGFHG